MDSNMLIKQKDYFVFDLGGGLCAFFKKVERSISRPSAIRSNSSNVGLRSPLSTKLNMDCETPDRRDTA
jgi:hypothetical protein